MSLAKWAILTKMSTPFCNKYSGGIEKPEGSPLVAEQDRGLLIHASVAPHVNPGSSCAVKYENERLFSALCAILDACNSQENRQYMSRARANVVKYWGGLCLFVYIKVMHDLKQLQPHPNAYIFQGSRGEGSRHSHQDRAGALSIQVQSPGKHLPRQPARPGQGRTDGPALGGVLPCACAEQSDGAMVRPGTDFPFFCVTHNAYIYHRRKYRICHTLTRSCRESQLSLSVLDLTLNFTLVFRGFARLCHPTLFW